MESLYSDGSATYLLIIWVEKNYSFNNEIETKTISLNCFSKYISTEICARYHIFQMPDKDIEIHND